MSGYLILALPRSRTAWLSRFLTYGEWLCGHEELRHMRSFDDIDAWLSQGCTGSAETAVAPWWRLIPKETKIVTIRRPVDEVVDSLMKLPGVTFDRPALAATIRACDRKLDQIEARRQCLSVRFEDLDDEATCAGVFEHCLPYPHDHHHWARLAPQNVQCNMQGLVRYAAANASAIEKLGKVAKRRILSRLASADIRHPDAMTFQSESFDTWLADAPALFDEHLIRVGEAPGDWQGKNIPLMRQLHAAGAMDITTARCNGRMFGYLVTMVAPSLHSRDVISAATTTFYASPDVPGLGLKLQRAALRTLRARGVGQVFYEAGRRGDGPRLGTMFRRLGAVEHGQTYLLELTGR